MASSVDSRTLVVDLGEGFLVSVAYDPEAIPAAYAETAQGFAAGRNRWGGGAVEKVAATAAALEAVLVRWDLQDGDRLLPLTRAGWGDVPVWILRAIHREIDADTFNDEE